MTSTKRVAREVLLWTGGALGALCLVALLAGWLFNVTPLVFASGSMSPTYDAGALGIAHQVPADELAVGDVVSVHDDDGARVTHRVVSIGLATDGSTMLHLQGDANDVADDQVYRVDEVDRVVAGVPLAGYVLNAAASPFGLAAGALLAGTALFLGFTPGGGGGRRATQGRGRLVLPVGVGAVLLGGTLGMTGQAPWAFTSAYWTDSANATVTATTPAPTVQLHAAPSCARSGSSVVLTFANVSAANEYYWEVRLRGQTTTTNEPSPSSGTVGAAVAQGGTVTITIAPNGNGNRSWDVAVFAQLEGQPGTRVGPTTTMINRQNNQGLFCGA